MPLQVRAGVDPRSVTGAWWAFGLVGALSIVAGVIVLAQPEISFAALAVIGGIFLLVDGIFEVIASLLGSRENRAMVALFGVITAVVGVILLRHPTHAVVAIALLFGLWLLIAGLLRLFRAFAESGPRFWAALLGVLELVAGIVIVSSPHIGVKTLALLVGISWVIRGIGGIVVAWALRRLHRAASEEDVAGVAPAST